MSAEQVCLKWSNFSLNITKNIDVLWKDESFVDVSLISEGQCIQAHKVILSASSPLFKSLFEANPCQHPVIILQDVKFRELVSIISFIYKGEVNILEDNLPALLQAAKTLQIHGLSDSVDNESLDRLFSLQNNEMRQERKSKKRKLSRRNEEKIDDDSMTVDVPDEIVPKQEPQLEKFSNDFLSSVTAGEELKVEDLVLNEKNQDILENEMEQNDDSQMVGKKLYQHMPFANLLPSAEIILRWTQTRSLDQLAIDLMKRLFSTEERLICNVNGKMGKPRFHTGKISLLREVLYYYSGLTPTEFEVQWKNCVTKIDTSNRGLKRNKKLRTQMFFMDTYLGKTFS